MANRWENLLLELTDELHRLSAKLQVLELENQKLREPAAPEPQSQVFVRVPSPDDGPPELPASSRRASSSSSGSASANLLGGSLPLNIRGTASATLREEPEQRNGNEVDVLKPTSSLRSDTAESTMPTFSAVTEDLGTASRASALIKEERMQFMIMRAQKTKNFVALKPWYIINPDSSGLANTWQLLTMCALGFVGLVTPVQVGLLKVEFGLLTVLSLAVDLVYVVDMILQFFTSYPRRTARGVEWEVRLPRITIHYLKTWFILDFVTLIPFDIIALTSGVEDVKELNGVKAIRVLRLVKLFRVLKTSKFTHKYEIPYSIPYQQVTLFKFLLILILVCHWLACVWALTLQLVSSDLPQWIDEVEAEDLEFGIQTRDSPVSMYIASFYFCSYTMTSVGYGDFGPRNILERVVCTVIVMVSGLLWAYVLGQVCAIVADMNAESQGFKQKMHHLNQMMHTQSIPQELQRRVRSFFLHNRNQALYVTQQQLLETMSPQLQAEVCTALTLPWLEKVTFFGQFMRLIQTLETRGVHTMRYRACIADISRQLLPVAFAQQESFDNVQELFILSKGLVALNSRVEGGGAVWGEDFVLSDTSLIRPVAGYALTYIEVLMLTRERFMDVIERRKLTCPQLSMIVRRYCVRVAVFRGILREARNRAREDLKQKRNLRRLAATAQPAQAPAVISGHEMPQLLGSVPEVSEGPSLQ